MNRDLFINSYLDRIEKKFSITRDMAFEILSMSAILDLSFDYIFDNICTAINGDGNRDGGIDGVYIDEDENEYVAHIFQVKNSKSIGDNILTKFINDYKNIFVTANSSEIPLNQKVKSVLENYKGIVSSGKIIENKLYFIFSGEKEEKDNTIIQRYKDENIEILDINDVYNKIENLITNKKRKTVNFSFMAEKSNISLRSDPQALISFQIQNIKAINFRLKVLDLCKLLDKEKDINERVDSVFSENIRGFLRYNRTNKNIKDTLESDDSEYFPFLNNGITIISEKIKIPSHMQAGIYPIETVNPVIVNGLQTTNVIYDIYNKDQSKLDGVYVLIRLYETSEPDLVNKITDATNTQSPINFRDKISNKKFNKYIKELFESNEIGFLTKRGDTFENSLSRQLKDSVESDVVYKFWYATYKELPEIAKNSKSKILEEIYEASENENHKLYNLFCGDKDSPLYEEMLNAYKIYKFVIKKKNSSLKTSDYINNADELISYGLYKLTTNDNEDGYQTICSSIEKIVDEEKQLLKDNGYTYSHNTYFKNAKSRYDLNRKLGFVSRDEGLLSST